MSWVVHTGPCACKIKEPVRHDFADIAPQEAGRVQSWPMLAPFLRESRVAYFSMEIALRSEIPTYAGGLGILAGDTLRSAADLRETVSIGRSAAAARKEPAASAWFGPFNLAHDTIEWRSVRGAKAPFAIIQRWTVSDSENIDSKGRPTPYGLLIVTRLPPGPVCHVAYVDVKANRDPNTLARQAADAHAQEFRCAVDSVFVTGERGRAIELILP